VRRILFFMFVLLVGCATSPSKFIGGDAQLHGCYKSVDNLGYNQTTLIIESGRFRVKVVGDVGEWGRASGEWARSGDELQLIVENGTDGSWSYISNLRISNGQSGPVLAVTTKDENARIWGDFIFNKGCDF